MTVAQLIEQLLGAIKGAKAPAKGEPRLADVPVFVNGVEILTVDASDSTKVILK
jgi:hypothetical protein